MVARANPLADQATFSKVGLVSGIIRYAPEAYKAGLVLAVGVSVLPALFLDTVHFFLRLKHSTPACTCTCTNFCLTLHACTLTVPAFSLAKISSKKFGSARMTPNFALTAPAPLAHREQSVVRRSNFLRPSGKRGASAHRYLLEAVPGLSLPS
jgi:hypothetical protein